MTHITHARAMLSASAILTANGDTPWVPLSPGRAFKPLRFFRDDSGYSALMRVDPGISIPPHRHTGPVHALTLEGWRTLCSGELVGPGDYVYEPAGNIDSWSCAGHDPVIVFIMVHGAVEYLDEDGSVGRRFSARTQEQVYRRYCEETGIEFRDLAHESAG